MPSILALLALTAFVLLCPRMTFAANAPGFVAAQAVRGHIVVINWEPSTTAGTITYKVYRGTGSTQPAWPGGFTSIASVVGDTSYVDEQPKATSTRYWYVVTASLPAPESAPSPILAPYSFGSTDPDTSDPKYYEEFYQPVSVLSSYQWFIGPTTMAPLEPKGVVLTGVDNSVTVTWSAVPSTNVLRYRIYRAEESGADGTLIATVNSPTTTYTDNTVTKYRHYWYRIAAEDTLNNIGYKSLEKHIRTDSSQVFPEPHGAGSSDPDADTCLSCHDLHEASGPRLLCYSAGGGEEELCMSCHDGTGSRYDVRREFTDPMQSSHEVTVCVYNGTTEEWETVVSGTFGCADCHTPHGDPGAAGSKKLLKVDGFREGNSVCYGLDGCHGPGGTTHWAGNMSAFESSDHNTKIPEPASGTKVKCSTCHMPHASPNKALWVGASYRMCLNCHSSDNVSLTSPDIYTRMTLNQDHDSHHDVLKRDQDANGTFIACQNCHNTHVVTTNRPLVDPDNPSIAGIWPEGPSAPMAVQNGSATAPRYNGHCLKCHDLSMPTAAQTGNWVQPPFAPAGFLTDNIAALYATNNCHGALSANGPVLVAASGYLQNDTLSCVTCHEPHGTINNYNLRGDVPKRDGTQLTANRMLVERRDNSGNQLGMYDTRFFCMSCHQYIVSSNPPSHWSTNVNQPKTYLFFPTSCTDRACHVHGTSTPKRF